MNNQEIKDELNEINVIARAILASKKSQTCGTAYQRWTYALLKAQEIYKKL